VRVSAMPDASIDVIESFGMQTHHATANAKCAGRAFG
jgi:hypothetical protein